ncbi:MAG: glycosyltransferase family 4 protein [Chloroflexota bacterium]
MKILQVLTYYRPWTSGLTIYVERLSKALAQLGHDVTVLTSQYDPDLPRYEVVDGVKVVRIPVALRVSKGVIMPSFGPMAWKLAQRADAIQLHLPQFDAPGVALRGRLLRKPVVLTYHCDLTLPEGAFNRFVDNIVLLMNRAAGSVAHAVATYTRDYGENSPYLSLYLGHKLKVIPPPVELADCTTAEAAAFHARHQLGNHPIIGICTRLATEKGVEILLRALPIVMEAFPDVRVLHAGQYQNVLGEEAYAARLAPLFAKYAAQYTLLGNLNGAELTAFYKNIDVLTIPSLNSTESFGLVQIEAMQNGVPVVSSNLPGVRQPVTMTGMGEVVAIGDHEALAAALIRVLRDKAAYVRSPELIGASFAPLQTAVEYLSLFADLQNGRFDPAPTEPAAYTQLRTMRDAWSR